MASRNRDRSTSNAWTRPSSRSEETREVFAFNQITKDELKEVVMLGCLSDQENPHLPNPYCRLDNPVEGQIPIWPDDIEAGLRGPLHEDIIALCRLFIITPTQLTSNSWRLAYYKLHGIKHFLNSFLQFYRLVENPKGLRHEYYFTPCQVKPWGGNEPKVWCETAPDFDPTLTAMDVLKILVKSNEGNPIKAHSIKDTHTIEALVAAGLTSNMPSFITWVRSNPSDFSLCCSIVKFPHSYYCFFRSVAIKPQPLWSYKPHHLRLSRGGLGQVRRGGFLSRRSKEKESKDGVESSIVIIETHENVEEANNQALGLRQLGNATTQLEEFKKSEERLLAYAIEVETSLKAIEAKLSFSEHRIAELKAEVEARKKEAAQLRLEKDNALHELERVFAATADAQEEAPEERRKAVEEAVAFC
ncbi:hypothetical protein CRG98_045947 [Punica granatum]|uniref:Uncharacterized protein n=1 Tax=Punica granatum TaxID=22663 RepID=A0A2I0HPN1_PUNGR|nr:hypothetical protein CRG98_045947 [Punica granatum]